MSNRETLFQRPYTLFEWPSSLLQRREVVATAVDGATLKQWLGPELAAKLEAQWGELRGYRGLCTQSDGSLACPTPATYSVHLGGERNSVSVTALVPKLFFWLRCQKVLMSEVCAGLQLGNIYLGVQPLLGIEGDPMRLMFERDLTPHPQYAAFYEWLWRGEGERGGADAVIHVGMHGTVEWLPGSPLGGTAESWPDKLLGSAPNIYLYAANNPSESILAKRRGYGTLVSYNVPPYARAGLYAELARAQLLLGEYRADPETEAALRPTLADLFRSTGLDSDVTESARACGHSSVRRYRYSNLYRSVVQIRL